nr:hypothetical protein [Tanacetum cinerariifolium]
MWVYFDSLKILRFSLKNNAFDICG